MLFRSPSVSHFRVFGSKCFILKTGNLDKFESRTCDGLFLGYPAHSRGFRVFNVETNIVQETCNVTFDETSPGARSDVSGDLQVTESIFVEEDEDEFDTTPSPAADAPAQAPEPATSASPPIEAPAASSSSAVPAEVEEVFSPLGAPLHIQKQHPPDQIKHVICRGVRKKQQKQNE